MDAHLGAIAFLAVLAYPKRSEIAKREKFFKTAKAWLLREHARDRKQIKKELRDIPTRAIYSSGPISAAERRILKQMSQGWLLGSLMLMGQTRALKAGQQQNMALNQWLGRVTTSKLIDAGPAIKMNGKEPSLRQAAHIVAGGKKGEADNVKGRLWKQCRPVLHLVIALRKYLQDHPGGQADILDLVTNPKWLIPVLRSAERLRSTYWPLMPFLGIKDDEPIRLVPKGK